MARVELAPEVADDLDRILDHLNQHQAEDASSRILDIVAAISVLERNLVIGRGSRGYLASYRYVAGIDTVFVLALRSQREAGTPDSDARAISQSTRGDEALRS